MNELGKIKRAEVGFGGYQGAQIGVFFELGGEGWGVVDFWGAWGIERNENAKWTEQDRIDELGNIMMRLTRILKDAKKEGVSDLAGVPVQIEWNGTQMKSCRVLTEVV